MKTISRLSLALICLAALSAPASGQDLLTSARTLYDAASYTEALDALDQVKNAADVAEVEKYRALCFLALGRSKDAEQSLEHLAMERPSFTFNPVDASPRLVTLFDDVRKRTFPAAVKEAYERGRASFDAGNMADANRQFKEVLTLTDDAPPEQAALMKELRTLAAGFARLSEPPPPPQAAPPPLPEVPPAPVVDPAPRPEMVYDATSPGVRPPVAVSRPVPPWTRPVTLRGFTFQGLLDLVIDEEGNVTQATMVKTIYASYDQVLVAAARKWRFQPATVNGRAVKYRATFPVTIGP